MTADELRRATGYLSSHYRISTTKTRHWAFAEVLECDPLTHGGAIVRIGNTDNGRHGWHSCGPRDLVIGAHVELFEFYIFGQWTMDFRVLREDE